MCTPLVCERKSKRLWHMNKALTTACMQGLGSCFLRQNATRRHWSQESCRDSVVPHIAYCCLLQPCRHNETSLVPTPIRGSTARKAGSTRYGLGYGAPACVHVFGSHVADPLSQNSCTFSAFLPHLVSTCHQHPVKVVPWPARCLQVWDETFGSADSITTSSYKG